MAAKIISQKGTKLKLEIEVDIKGSLLEAEEAILQSLNEAGQAVTKEAIKRFDADGTPIKIGDVKLTARTKSNKKYQTPYGAIDVERYVYQTSKGGRVYRPLEDKARIIGTATPRLAKMLSNKYARMNARDTIDDLEDNHGRKITLVFLQNVADAVGSIAQAKEEVWEYETPKLEERITTVGISLDGAHLPMSEEGYRESMVGTISLYNENGDRQHTIYIGAAPEYGKASFMKRLEKEIAHVKKTYPKALYIGIADGAKTNWPFLKKHTDKQILDFYHATEYLGEVTEAVHPEKTGKQKRLIWMKERCHQLKHDRDGAEKILEELKKLSHRKKLRAEIKDNLKSAITYFTNQLPLMNYSYHVKNHLPIGSGVTEAACKTLIKQRFCCSGMKWKQRGIKVVLSLRSLVQTKGRWDQFWDKINQYGVA